MREIAEADWKIWRRLSKMALDRYCQKVLNEAAEYANGASSGHQRYLDLYSYIQKCDETIGSVFNNPRRSTAFFSITNARRQNLISREELNEFSDDTKLAITILLG